MPVLRKSSEAARARWPAGEVHALGLERSAARVLVLPLKNPKWPGRDRAVPDKQSAADAWCDISSSSPNSICSNVWMPCMWGGECAAQEAVRGSGTFTKWEAAIAAAKAVISETEIEEDSGWHKSASP